MVVMAGLGPAINALGGTKQDVDARHEAGHDDETAKNHPSRLRQAT